jgi:hypothetical protein
MIEIKVNEIINWFYSDYKDKLVNVHTIKCDTLENCFKSVYTMRRSCRYDSARRYDFDDPVLESQYNDWKQKNETIEMFYGGATID